jgi:hypothetical protein
MVLIYGMCSRTWFDNTRLLGRVRHHVDESHKALRFLLVTECLSRVLKDMIRERLRCEMRASKVIGEEPYKKCVVRYPS